MQQILIAILINSLRIPYFHFHLNKSGVGGGKSMVFSFIIYVKFRKVPAAKNVGVASTRCALEYSLDPNVESSTNQRAKTTNET